MFKGLTQRAQKILTVLSQEEARQSFADMLLPEHIILAILKDGEGLACRGLKSFNINCLTLHAELEAEVPRRSENYVYGDLPPSRRTRQLMDLAAKEAQDMVNSFIGTEHIFLAALLEKNAILSKIMSKYNLDIDLLRASYHALSTNETNANRNIKPPFQSITSNNESANKRQGTGSASSKTPLLDEFARNLTLLAKSGKLDQVIGREVEITRLIRILTRRSKNNPVLVGEPGVGKTAIVEGLAQLLTSDKAPDSLCEKSILTLDLAAVVAGTKYRGEFEDRLKKIMKEILSNKNIILFIDEIHTIIGAGGAEGSIDASNMLKPALARGELQCIGATSLNEYRKYFEKDAALDRRFQMVLIEEPNTAETVQILQGIQQAYEDHHGVIYSKEAIIAAVNLSQRYINGKFMPDKAIDLIDEAGAMKKMATDKRPEVLQDVEQEIIKLNEDKSQMVLEQEYEKAAEIRDKVGLARRRLDLLRQEWELGLDLDRPIVDEQDIRTVISEITSIPLFRLEEAESKKLISLEKDLQKSVIGQNEAVALIASSIRRSRAGISSPKRPQGSFIFLGPTGVGKTLLARKLAENLFGKEEALVRIDMSDYMEKHNASRLVGSPPGYVGYEEGGVLTEQIRRNPYRVVLFDEIEKAHSDVFNLLLQVLEEGELKDNLGHTVSFKSTVIIMTSNVGAREFDPSNKLGFNNSSEILKANEIRSSAMNELKRLFRPEFINRVDDIVVFKPLGREEILKILDIEIEELAKRLREKHWELNITSRARNYLFEKSWDIKYGARPIRRTIQRELEDPISLYVLEHNSPENTIFHVEIKRGKLNIVGKQTEATQVQEATVLVNH